MAEGDVGQHAQHDQEEEQDARIQRHPAHAIRVLLQAQRLLRGHSVAGGAAGRVAGV